MSCWGGPKGPPSPKAGEGTTTCLVLPSPDFRRGSHFKQQHPLPSGSGCCCVSSFAERLALACAFRGRGVDLATGNHGRRAGDGRRADPCAEIRSTIGTRTGRRKRRDGGVGGLHWLG